MHHTLLLLFDTFEAVANLLLIRIFPLQMQIVSHCQYRIRLFYLL